MKRTTIFVPEALERDLQLYARRTGKPTAAVVREALAAYIAREQPATVLPSFASAFDSGFTDTAERHEELLFRHLSPHAPASPKRVERRRAAPPAPTATRATARGRRARKRR
jgi:predicted transcriptional regulator